MTTAKSLPLESTLEAIAAPGVLIGHRMIAHGDEFALLPEEQSAFKQSVVKVQRASGAARIVARGLMQRMGIPSQAVLKTAAGMPQWPKGFVGSMAHDSTVAIAALASRDQYLSIGVDIEPAEALEPSLIDLIATERERGAMGDSALQGRLLFVIKEAVYKTVYPLDHTFLEHHDVEVNFAARTATVRQGRTVAFRFGMTPSIAALAYVAAPQMTG